MSKSMSKRLRVKILICVFRSGNRSDKSHLKFCYTSFAVDSLASGESKSQLLKCTVRLCLFLVVRQEFRKQLSQRYGIRFYFRLKIS